MHFHSRLGILPLFDERNFELGKIDSICGDLDAAALFSDEAFDEDDALQMFHYRAWRNTFRYFVTEQIFHYLYIHQRSEPRAEIHVYP
jgi:hypothetical protein